MQPRRLPKFAIVSHLKRAGVRQVEIARRAGTTQSTVSRVLSRTIRDTEIAERVWQEVERALGGRHAA